MRKLSSFFCEDGVKNLGFPPQTEYFAFLIIAGWSKGWSEGKTMKGNA